jgi:RNA polymerase sigma-70 factor (ECF subfamily)
MVVPLKKPFHDLVHLLRKKDGDAAEEVFQRFSRRLVGLAATRLPANLRAKIDPEDVVQSVFKSFFRRISDGQFLLEDWDSMWTLLTVLTVRKCGHRLDQFLAARRDVRRERSVSNVTEDAADTDVPDPSPTAYESLLLLETVDQVLQGLKEADRPVVMLRLQGYNIKEITEQTGRSERTVHRALETVREKLLEMLEE